jgi:hypothetical protein
MATLESQLGSYSGPHRYSGPDRRHYRVLVTQNSEYHCKDTTCIAVRDLKSGSFQSAHPAVGRRMSGGICFTNEGSISSFTKPGEWPHPGERVLFSAGKLETELQTSPLVSVSRPPKNVVRLYS